MGGLVEGVRSMTVAGGGAAGGLPLSLLPTLYVEEQAYAAWKLKALRAYRDRVKKSVAELGQKETEAKREDIILEVLTGAAGPVSQEEARGHE